MPDIDHEGSQGVVLRKGDLRSMLSGERSLLGMAAPGGDAENETMTGC